MLLTSAATRLQTLKMGLAPPCLTERGINSARRIFWSDNVPHAAPQRIKIEEKHEDEEEDDSLVRSHAPPSVRSTNHENGAGGVRAADYKSAPHFPVKPAIWPP